MEKMDVELDGPEQSGFHCEVCHTWHDALPFSYSVKAPFAVAAIPEQELERRVVFTLDQCVIDQRDFYLRGRIVVPVLGEDRPFIWGVWAKVSAPDFIRTDELWKIPGREREPAYPGRLNTQIPLYGDTLNLELLVQTQVVGRRPHFELMQSSHPFALEQRAGISLGRVRRIAEHFLHPEANLL